MSGLTNATESELKGIVDIPKATRHRLATGGVVTPVAKGPGGGSGHGMEYSWGDTAALLAYSDLKELGFSPSAIKPLLTYLQSLPGWQGELARPDGEVYLVYESFPEIVYFDGSKVVEGTDPRAFTVGVRLAIRPRYYVSVLLLASRLRELPEWRRFAVLLTIARGGCGASVQLKEAALRLLEQVGSMHPRKGLEKIERFLMLKNEAAAKQLFSDYKDWWEAWQLGEGDWMAGGAGWKFRRGHEKGVEGQST